MAKYKVQYRVEKVYEIEVDAPNEEEAYEAAEECWRDYDKHNWREYYEDVMGVEAKPA